MRRFGMVAPLIAAMTAVTVAACGDTTAIESGGTIGIRFARSSSPLTPAADLSAAAPLDLDGTNGTLSIDDVRLIVRRFEVDLVDDQCGDDAEHDVGDDHGGESRGGGGDEGRDDHENDACEKFRAPPAFVPLPLDGEGALVVEQPVPAGVYDRVRLQIDRVDDDEDDHANDNQSAMALLATVRQEFPAWPGKASIRVEGTFTPTGGSPRPFVAYFDAEIEVEMALDPPLVIGDSDSPIVTIEVDPRLWFTRADGSVVDLSAFDFETTGRIAGFEIEVRKGFVHTHCDD